MNLRVLLLLCLTTITGLSLRRHLVTKLAIARSHILKSVSSSTELLQEPVEEINDLLLSAIDDEERIGIYEKILSEPKSLSSMRRVGFNTVINSFCKVKKYTEALRVVATMEKMNISLAPDTMHIILVNSFKNDTTGQTAEYYYTKYFNSSANGSNIDPNARTLNIMMEGFRSANSISKVLEYHEMFSKFNIQPDIYTMSSRIRISTSSRECLALLQDSVNNELAQSPLVRCVIETLGELGSPAASYSVACRYLEEGNRLNESSSSGDSLLAALLSSRSTTIKPSSSPKVLGTTERNEQRLDVATYTSSKWSDFCSSTGDYFHEETNNIAGEHPTLFAMKLILKNRIRFGPKGFCIVLSHFQKLRQMDNSDDLYLNLGDGQVIELRSVDSFRDVLWTNVKAQKLIDENNLNGRVCDALLRSYSTDIDAARKLWKEELLPIAQRVRKCRGMNAYREITEKAFEGLMYLCGVTYRPDVALEIALAVRKRNWSLQMRSKLSQAYSRGYTRKGSKAQIQRANNFNILNRGLERSVEAELGVLFSHNRNERDAYKNKITRIRVKFK